MVSPYLRRPLRTLEEVKRTLQRQAARQKQTNVIWISDKTGGRDTAKRNDCAPTAQWPWTDRQDDR